MALGSWQVREQNAAQLPYYFILTAVVAALFIATTYVLSVPGYWHAESVALRPPQGLRRFIQAATVVSHTRP